MKLAIYPGTFDPVTNGHLDIVERAVQLFDAVTIAVTTNPTKNPLFTVAERIMMFREATRHLPRIEVESFSGLLVEYAAARGASVLIRGLRAISDFEYEFQMALINRKISHGLDTVFLMASEKYTYLNSTIVKEVARLGGDVSCFVPPAVNERIRQKLAQS
ncbi:MAG: pantetheine-phosphate adenylyltransferase [candidate division KSB1 bacterium]|nr:pantetheine-phosphate adenylyltransferase [candidate division KSB1 bacterium]MDZ7274456.1 pantetheine-phosphate adenylyltransferase [candidate division KSB1 bacterium]MDZ7284882.1 pantetheine-phosphate adenylyltransferase [candidate division KSB1 bacterium]MDZ7297697.1 pantetheine-phosphate adenylyltransferase [candidate division KSB1 bacterium]MDZ7305879.1 pantetheine-phosphate adenylyltransferase [candidate division KSB1 bacterium]